MTLNSLTSTPSIHPDVAWRDLDGEVLLVQADDATVRTLNPVGGFAFSLFDGKTSLVAVADAIVGEFNVTKEVARQDLLAFVVDLDGRGVLAWSEATK
jgi:hypothetical protein